MADVGCTERTESDVLKPAICPSEHPTSDIRDPTSVAPREMSDVGWRMWDVRNGRNRMFSNRRFAHLNIRHPTSEIRHRSHQGKCRMWDGGCGMYGTDGIGCSQTGDLPI